MTQLWMRDWGATNNYLWTTLALLGVWAASLPTAAEILKKGNAADPLRREILDEQRRQAEVQKCEERRKKEESPQASGAQS